jgi:hypothetical protein
MKTLSHPVAGPRGAAAVLLTLFLALFFTAPAYACHNGQPHGKDKTPCLNPLEGVESLNEAQFNDNYIVMDPQLQAPGHGNPGFGDYVDEELLAEVATTTCRTASNQRSADTRSWTPSSRPERTGPVPSTPDEFSYG